MAHIINTTWLLVQEGRESDSGAILLAPVQNLSAEVAAAWLPQIQMAVGTRSENLLFHLQLIRPRQGESVIDHMERIRSEPRDILRRIMLANITATLRRPAELPSSDRNWTNILLAAITGLPFAGDAVSELEGDGRYLALAYFNALADAIDAAGPMRIPAAFADIPGSLARLSQVIATNSAWLEGRAPQLGMDKALIDRLGNNLAQLQPRRATLDFDFKPASTPGRLFQRALLETEPGSTAKRKAWFGLIRHLTNTDRSGKDLSRSLVTGPYLQDQDSFPSVIQGEFGVAGAQDGIDVLKTIGAWPCAVLTIYDPQNQIGMIAHIDEGNAVYPDSYRGMREAFVRLGGDPNRAKIRITGSNHSVSQLLASSVRDVLKQNWTQGDGQSLAIETDLQPGIRHVALDLRTGIRYELTDILTNGLDASTRRERLAAYQGGTKALTEFSFKRPDMPALSKDRRRRRFRAGRTSA